MTELKLKGKKYSAIGQIGWFVPALWMSAGDISFTSYVVKINGKTYTTWSEKFSKAYEDDRIIRTLME